MSKLILSSCDFRNSVSARCIYGNLPISISQCKVLYFPNEKATEQEIKGKKFYDRLAAFGFSIENICVFNYFSPSDCCRNTDIDVIYVSGGNTFGTLKRIRESGADKIILDYISKGVTYIGGSAGAHIASRSIEHVSKYDVEKFGIIDFSGLKLFDGVLICHYSDERKEDYEDLVRQGVKNVIKLSDTDCIVIEV